jgi:hypothetical protein
MKFAKGCPVFLINAQEAHSFQRQPFILVRKDKIKISNWKETNGIEKQWECEPGFSSVAFFILAILNYTINNAAEKIDIL